MPPRSSRPWSSRRPRCRSARPPPGSADPSRLRMSSGALRAEPLLQPAARRRSRCRRVAHVEVVAARRCVICARVHAVHHAHRRPAPQVLDEGVRSRSKVWLSSRNSTRSVSPLRVAAQAVVAHRPARLVQQRRGPAQVAAVDLPLAADTGHHRRRRSGSRRAAAPRPPAAAGSPPRPAMGGPSACSSVLSQNDVDPRVEAVEQRRVGPFEVEHQPDGLAHARVLELLAAQVEDQSTAPLARLPSGSSALTTCPLQTAGKS